MAKKISQLGLAGNVTVNDLFQVVDKEDTSMAASGTNKRITAATLGNFLPVTATGSSASRTLKDRFSDTVNVKDFGAVGDGVTDDTAAIQAALNSAPTSGLVYIPSGTYIVSGVIIPTGCCFYGTGVNSIIKRKSGTSNPTYIINCNSYCIIKDLSIEGNASTQSSFMYGILGQQVRNVIVKNTKVTNIFGIGISWSDSAYCECDHVEVAYCKNERVGFHNDTYSNTSFFGEGGHKYIECISQYNELDGINVATPNNKIIGGDYSYNGLITPTGGALGAAGIFCLDGETQSKLLISGVTANNNGEYGIAIAASDCLIQGCITKNNALSGIMLKTGTRNVVDSNVCGDNGYYAGTSNPNVWVRGGISFFPSTSLNVISNNTCYDSRPNISMTQQYGIFFASAASSDICSGYVIIGNQTEYNKLGNDNINPAFNQPFVNLTKLIYNDFKAGEYPQVTPSVSSATPNIYGARMAFLGLGGSVSITNLLGGATNQIVTIFAQSNTVTVTHNTNIRLTGGTNVVLSTFMSSVTLIFRDTKWYEIGRNIFP